MQFKKVHFIAIGGSIMHNLALALHNKGVEVTGSDDEIYDPAKSKLEKASIIPAEMGWNSANITDDLDAIVLGMHAKKDNPELIEAQNKGIKIYSFPELIFELSKNKQRVVIAGSHGKTTITSMILHVLKYVGKDFDYAVGSSLEGFDLSVKLTDAPIIIIEGDEYPSSALDNRPKFAHYKQHIGVISGIAWDHFNIYNSIEEYRKQFENFADSTPKAGTIIYNNDDDYSSYIAQIKRNDVNNIEYTVHKHDKKKGKVRLLSKKLDPVEIDFFGDHNLSNLSAALNVCEKLGIKIPVFYEAIQSFKGAGKRMELIGKNEDSFVYKDFAHAPSKLKATSKSVLKHFDNKAIVSCYELHTFSSINPEFIDQYKNQYLGDKKAIFYSPEVSKKKGLQPLSNEDIKTAFNDNYIEILNNTEDVKSYFLNNKKKDSVYLFMSSGTYNGLDLSTLSNDLLS